MTTPRPPRHGVFINYRRQDAAFHAGWLYEQLGGHFGQAHIFKDVDSIEPGEDFMEAIATAVRSCHTMLVVIGPKWASATDQQAVPRIAKPDDFVRLEIEMAMKHGLQIIPVLVLDAAMPSPDELPSSIVALARRNALEITSSHFQDDVARLVRAIDRNMRQLAAETQYGPSARIQPEAAEAGHDGAQRIQGQRYQLGEVLGYGGMSEVHGGWDTRLGRDVAVKVLRADLARDPRLQMRFRRETQNVAALNHPGIVAVYDTGETQSEFGPLPYIVMEYVDGQTLREIVKTSGPMSQQRVIEVLADVCAALDFSHRHNIIHRDVKPANVMINRAGAVKVMDFGIARALGEGQNVTQTAAVIGTAQYLSPEQARGEAVDARSDVYAVGCVLFELLTGEPPFTGDSPVAVAYQHVREDPRAPSELNPAVPPALDAVVLKALSKNPANRYQSAAEMRSDLVRVRSGQAPLAPVVLNRGERTAMRTPESPTMPGLRLDVDQHTPPPAYYDPPPAYYDEPRRGTGKVVGAALAVLVALGFIGFVAYQVLAGPRAPEQVAVPLLIGKTEQDARNQLADAGLRVGDVRQIPSDIDRIGQVIATDPAAGVPVNTLTPIALSIGTGPESVTVPRVSGLSLSDATAALASAGLKVGTVTQIEGAADQVGKVIASDPEPGTMVDGASPVNLSVGIEATTVPIPSVIGQDAADAQKTLENAGFAVTRETVDAGGDQGSVVGTSPTPGSQAKKGSTVTLQISSGDGGGQRPVPNVLNQDQQAAAQIMSAAGFTRITTVSQPVLQPELDGRVIEQSPAAGQNAGTGDEIQLVIGRV